MSPTARFINGVFFYEGRGLDTAVSLGPSTSYTVPGDKRAQLIYLRAGNSSGELIYLQLLRDGKVMRYFPIGARASVHVPLSVVEDIFPQSKIDLLLAAPKGVTGALVLDVGLLEVD
jgi:hypothetical protein